MSLYLLCVSYCQKNKIPTENLPEHVKSDLQATGVRFKLTSSEIMTMVNKINTAEKTAKIFSFVPSNKYRAVEIGGCINIMCDNLIFIIGKGKVVDDMVTINNLEYAFTWLMCFGVEEFSFTS